MSPSDSSTASTSITNAQILLKDVLDADGNKSGEARKQLTEFVTPMVGFQTDKFCRRFCQNRFLRERCTLTPPLGRGGSDLPLCDEANASYAWMLDDLTHEKRLANIEAESEKQLAGYFRTIINSMPFYERWKNWRFGRRIHIPTYVNELSPHAGKVFYALQSGKNIHEIIQSLGLNQDLVTELIDKIIIELSQRKRLHLLQQTRTHTFSELAQTSEDDEVATYDVEDSEYAPERLFAQHQVRKAWGNLDEIEQFVVEALVIEQQDANHVLLALTQQNISLKKGQKAEDNNRQQLYYLKRKALEKLSATLNT